MYRFKNVERDSNFVMAATLRKRVLEYVDREPVSISRLAGMFSLTEKELENFLCDSDTSLDMTTMILMGDFLSKRNQMHY